MYILKILVMFILAFVKIKNQREIINILQDYVDNDRYDL